MNAAKLFTNIYETTRNVRERMERLVGIYAINSQRPRTPNPIEHRWERFYRRQVVRAGNFGGRIELAVKAANRMRDILTPPFNEAE